MISDVRTQKRTDDAQELTRLLCRALSRLAVAAQGIDQRLDELLADLRQLLRREIDNPHHLSALIDTIDARIKVVDDERDQRGDLLQDALQLLIEQLLAARPSANIARELKTLQKELKQVDDGEELKLLKRLPVLQAQVLENNLDVSIRGGLLSRLFGRGDTSPVQSPTDDADAREEVSAPKNALAASPSAAASPTIGTVSDALISVESDAETAIDTRVEMENASEPHSTQPVDSEPPFTRIAAAVCQVLDHLLQQIDPPPTASDHYRHAREQIAKGLNWYELVSTLEEIGVIVLAALERGQGEFQEFLLGISKRLEEAHHVIEISRGNQALRRQDDDALDRTVRGEMQQMQAQVAAATQIDQLKMTIASRFDSVFGALDHHRAATTQRQQELETQLGALTERLQDMEVQSAAIEKRMLEQQRLALIDTLTQLPNRKAYDQRVVEESERWRRYGRPLALAVCDVDNFKSINDQFGHLAGDKVLRIIAKTLRQRLRKSDFIARFGGEEFVILLPETDRAEARGALETLRAAVEESPFHFRDQRVAVTVSIGIADFNEGATLEAVFERADAALYQAKQAGRNRCIVAGD